MTPSLTYAPSSGAMYRGASMLDPWTFTWQPGTVPPDARPVAPLEALALLNGRPGTRRLPVGVIGPKRATAQQIATAELLGRGIGEAGLTLLCGGKTGVMEAACRGAASAGGLTIGILPDEEWQAANPYVAIPIATGIGPARNAVIARACPVLVAVGGEYGTLSEIAFGLHFGRRVLTLEDAPVVPGAVACPDVPVALQRMAEGLLGLDVHS